MSLFNSSIRKAVCYSSLVVLFHFANTGTNSETEMLSMGTQADTYFQTADIDEQGPILGPICPKAPGPKEDKEDPSISLA